MKELDVIQRTKELISQSLSGYEIESPKVDCKLKWYNLSEKEGKNEFVKDVCAIANSLGQDGMIIIGFSDSKKKFQDVSFSDTGLGDSSYIQNIISSFCSDVFNVATYDLQFGNNMLSVIHIPPITNKPIIMLKYLTRDKNGELNRPELERIFIRRNTSNQIANKSDLDLIYFNRNNLNADYEYSIDHINHSLYSSYSNSYKEDKYVNRWHIELNIENFGKRVLALKKMFNKI